MKIKLQKISPLIISALIVLLGHTVLAENRIFLPEGVYFHRFASTVSGPQAIWINPAAMGTEPRIYTALIGEINDDGFADDWAYAITGDKIGIAYRQLDNFLDGKYKEYTFAVGSGFGYHSSLGISYKYVKSSAGIFNKKHFWNIGFMMSSSPQMKLAFVLSNMNRSRINNEKGDIEQMYSISYRPQRLPIWISIEASLSSGQSMSSASYTYGLEGHPMKNMNFHVSYNNNGNIEVGVSMFFTKLFGGAQGRFDDNFKHKGTSVYGGFHYLPSRKR